jgi:hypothetical protein
VNLELSIWLIRKWFHISRNYAGVCRSDLFGFLYLSKLKPLSICYSIDYLSTINIEPSSTFTNAGFLIGFKVKVQESLTIILEKCLSIS